MGANQTINENILDCHRKGCPMLSQTICDTMAVENVIDINGLKEESLRQIQEQSLFLTYGNPRIIDTIINEDSIELVYIEELIVGRSWTSPERRVYKVVFSCKDGKWHKSEPIYGDIIPQQEERYEFQQPIK